MKLGGISLFLLGILLGAAPVALGMIASAIAASHGCTLHEGYSNPCLIFGYDWGDTLYSMFVGTWLSLITIPVGAVIALVGLILFFIGLLSGQKAGIKADNSV